MVVGFLDDKDEGEEVSKAGGTAVAEANLDSDKEPIISMIVARSPSKSEKGNKKKRDDAGGEIVREKKKKKQKLGGERSESTTDVEASYSHLLSIIECSKKDRAENVSYKERVLQLQREIDEVQGKLEQKNTELVESTKSFTSQISTLESKVKDLEGKVEEYRSAETLLREAIEAEKEKANSAEKKLKDSMKSQEDIIVDYKKSSDFHACVRKSSRTKFQHLYDRILVFLNLVGLNSGKTYDDFASWQTAEDKKRKDETAKLKSAQGELPSKSETQSHI